MPQKRYDALPSGTFHCLEQTPYRMVVYVRSNGATPLYQVAGSNREALGARKALLEAHRVHGGACFYCKNDLAADDVTIDHVEPRASGGRAQIQNLLLACGGCNRDKADKPIEYFNSRAGREWLSAVLKEVQRRLVATA